MSNLPSGTVTFLFTDVEGSTVRWEQQPEAMRTALARHDALIRAAIEEHDGHVVKTMGDAFHAAFSRVLDGLAAAVDAQRRLQAEPWGEIGPLRVRMALHTGAAEERDGDYYGQPLNRAARLLATGHGGQVLLSDVTAGLVRDDLSDGLELLDLGDHRLKDLTRAERVFQLVAPDLPAEFPPLVSLDARPNNLPMHATPLLGRERELVSARERLLRPDVRLLTLVGPGGTGKTRLSLQIAADVSDRFLDGVFFVALAPISDPALVPSTIAQTLGVRDGGGRPVLDSLKEYLREKQLLMLLDNFEQILAAAPVVSELLNAAPQVKILVTSRSALQVRGEHEEAVPPLALPDARSLSTPDALSQYSAVALFVERATAIRPDFTVTNENAPAVAEICHRLDGLPLAIELAAARIRFLSPQAILARLERRLPLLTGGARDLPARQQTLRSAIAWSYDLLTPDEQALYRRLSIFVGGCTLGAGCWVSGLGGDDADSSSPITYDPEPETLDGIGSLVAQSLLREIGTDAEPRFGMLETIREFGLEMLEAAGEVEVTRRRHVEYFVAYAEQRYPRYEGAQNAEWSDRMQRDHDNLRAALTWSQEVAADIEAGPRIAGALWTFWYPRGHKHEGRAWAEQMLDLPASPAVRARLTGGAGVLAFLQGDSTVARACLEEARSIWQSLGDEQGVAFTLHRLGMVARQQGNLDVASELIYESVAIWRRRGERAGLAVALTPASLVAQSCGDAQAALAFAEEAESITRDLGNRASLPYALRNVGTAALSLGDLPRARAAFDESNRRFQENGDEHGQVELGPSQTALARREGDVARVARLCHECLALRRKHGSLWNAHQHIDDLAWVAMMRGQPDQAARLIGAADAIRRIGRRPIHPLHRDGHERLVAELRSTVGEEAYEAARHDGEQMTVDEVIAYAVEASRA